MRPTLQEMQALRYPIAPKDAPDRLGDVLIISGRLDVTGPADADLVLSGGHLLRPIAEESLWRWRVIGKPSKEAREQWPCWDGIVDKAPVTSGHVEGLRRGGWL